MVRSVKAIYCKTRRDNVEEICGGLCIIFPLATTVEANFSRMRNEKSDFRENLTYLSIEALMQYR